MVEEFLCRDVRLLSVPADYLFILNFIFLSCSKLITLILKILSYLSDCSFSYQLTVLKFINEHQKYLCQTKNIISTMKTT